MATSTINIRNKIKEKLDAMQSLNSTYDYASSKFDGEYPAATLRMSSGSGEITANVRSLTSYVFDISIFVELGSNFTPQKAERVSGEVLDEMLSAFRADVTLSGTITYMEPVSWEGGYENRENDTRVLNLTLNCQKIETTNSTLP